MRKKIVAGIVVLGLLSSAVLNGCSGGEGPEQAAQTESGNPEKPYDGTTLTVLGFSAVTCSAMEEKLPEFTEKTGIQVEFEQLSNDELKNKIAVSMAAGGSDVDAFYFQPFQDLGAYQANGWVEPLDEYFQDDEDFDVEDFLDIPVEQGTRDDGKLYAVPVFDEHYVLYYNKDYFQEAGIEKVPETYEELIETAKKLTDPDKNRYGISMRGDGFASVLTWITVARAYGADYFKDGVCDLTSPEAKKAIEVYQELLKYSPPGYLSKGWSETSDDFAQGIAAMRIDCDTQYTYATDPESSLVADSVGFAVVPKGDVKASGSESGWSLAMSAGSKNKGAAWEFIRWASGKEMDVYAAAQGNFSARESTWENEEVLKTYPEDLVEAVLAVSDPEISDGGTLPDLQYASEARSSVGEALSLAWQGEDYEDALKAASEELQKLYDEQYQ